MKKIFGMKFKIFFFLLVLFGASLACNYPDAVKVIVEAAVEKCVPVSRSEYESTAARLGHTPETPKYPESAIYQVCYVNNEASTVRMTDGNSTVDEGSEEKKNIPVGTYIYEMYVNDEPPPGGDNWEYEFESDFSIRVASDGTVTGFKIFKIWVDSVSDTGCATRSEEAYTTNVSGFLEGNQGSAILEDKGWSFWEFHGDECGDGKNIFKDEEGVREALITVSGNQMEISYQGEVIYTLTKE